MVFGELGGLILGPCDEQGVIMATMEGSGDVSFGKEVQTSSSGSQTGLCTLVASKHCLMPAGSDSGV